MPKSAPPQQSRTIHQKAIEAAAKAIYMAVITDTRPHHSHPEWESTSEAVREEYRRLAEAGRAAGLASARESGWEMKPRKLSFLPDHEENPWTVWFDAAPRFEDAP